MPMNFRIGFGYDSHRFQEGGPLVIGGVSIPFEKGFVAHSDGDLLIHALCDALLGAAALRDIGTHFPDNDPSLTNINSKIILQKTVAMLSEQGWQVNNVDITLVIQQPKMAPYIPEMTTTLAQLLQVPETSVSVKAKTNEKMDAVGRGEGAEAYAVATILRAKS